MDKPLHGHGGEEKGVQGKKSKSEKGVCDRVFAVGLWEKLVEKSCFLGSSAGLTHLPELVVNQLQPGHVQVVQVVAAEGRRPGAAAPLQPAASFAPQLRQQPGGKNAQLSTPGSAITTQPEGLSHVWGRKRGGSLVRNEKSTPSRSKRASLQPGLTGSRGSKHTIQHNFNLKTFTCGATGLE